MISVTSPSHVNIKVIPTLAVRLELLSGKNIMEVYTGSESFCSSRKWFHKVNSFCSEKNNLKAIASLKMSIPVRDTLSGGTKFPLQLC